MFWHSRMWAGAVLLCALAFTSSAEAADPAPAPAPVVAVPVPVVVVTPPDNHDDDWSVFTGHGTRGGHLVAASLGIGAQFVPEAGYRYNVTDNLGLGLRVGSGPSFIGDGTLPQSIVSTNGLRLNLSLTAQLFAKGRWSLGLDVAPGILWHFNECPTCTETRAALLYLSVPLLYAVVPRVFSIGGSLDLLTDFNFQDSHVTVDFPLLIGGIAELHVTKNLALTAEAKFGAWFNTFVQQSTQPVFLISRFTIGLAFYGVP